MAELQTDFNVYPYYDDYNEDDQYYRILFRPGTAVQARELTQLQTILQKQVSRFGDSVYRNGTKIEGLSYRVLGDKAIKQIKFKDSNTITFDFANLAASSNGAGTNTYLLVSNTSGLRASIYCALEGAESAVLSGSFDTNRAYVTYLNVGNNAGTPAYEFSTTSEQIDVYSTTQDKTGNLNGSNRLGSIYTLSSNALVNALGVGVGMHLSPGVIYQKGYFLKTLAQDFMLVEHTTNTQGYQVGFRTDEYIIQPSQDANLYDNAIGSSNYLAPGAHRLKLVPSPIWFDATNNAITIPEDFLPVLEFNGNEGRLIESGSGDPSLPILSAVGDILARRTLEESGDYIVKPFQIDVVAHESNTQSFYYTVSPGIAYVDGYRVEYKFARRLEVPRAITTKDTLNQRVTLNMGNYIKVNDFAGTIKVEENPVITFYSTPQNILSENQSMTSPLGDPVGNANVRAVLYEAGTKGVPNGQWLVYIYNLKMNPGKTFAANAYSFYIDGTYGKVFGDLVSRQVYEGDSQLLVYDTGLNGVKRLTDNTGMNSTELIYRKTFTGSLNSIGGGESEVEFTISSGDEFNFGTGTLTDENSENVNIFFGQDTLANNALVTNAANTIANSTHITITSPTSFTGPLYVGHALKITNSNSSSTYNTITHINSANSVTVTPITIPDHGVSDTLTLKQWVKKGTPVNLAGSGNTITVASGSTTITVDLKMDPDSAGGPYTMYAHIPVVRTGANPIGKDVEKNRVIKIDPSTNAGGTYGPWNLGLTDAYRIANVHVGATYDDTNDDRKDWFVLIDGQTDAWYGHSKLALNPKFKGYLNNTDKLLVKVDRFSANISSTKAGFFSIDSYPIDDTNTANTMAIQTAMIPFYTDNAGEKYDLRNHIDFRLVMTDTANSTTLTADATENPANNTTTFKTAAGADIALEPDSNFAYSIEHYLARYDSIVVNSKSIMSVKQGEPADRPVKAPINNTGLELATVYVPPYPSLTFTEAE